MVSARQYRIATIAGRLDGSSHIAICRIHGRGATALHIHCDSRSLVLRKGSRDRRLCWRTYLPLYRARLVWRIDTFAVVAGVAIGLLWIAFGFQDQSRAFALDNALASLPLSLWLGWVLVRLIGTIALVPVAEELIFRGYLLDRFSHNGEATRVIGLLLSTVLFAVMHGRWALAGCAGLVYGLIYLRSSRVTDSIVAHSASNADNRIVRFGDSTMVADMTPHCAAPIHDADQSHASQSSLRAVSHQWRRLMP